MHQPDTRQALMTSIAVLAALLLVACGTVLGGAMHNTITARDAELRVEDYITKVLTALPAQAHLANPFKQTYACDDPTDNGPKGRVIAGVDYRIDGLAPDQYSHYLDLLTQWWTSHDFRVLEDARPKTGYIWVENNTDAFRMSTKTNDRGELYLTATSPCVWPNGTPQPNPS